MRAWTGLVLSAVGLAAALVLAGQGAGGGGGRFCAEGGGCERVLGSAWASVLGVRWSVLGAVYWSAMLAAGLTLLATGGKRARTTAAAGAWIGGGVSIYLVAVQLLAIGAVCPLCMTSAACAFGLTALAAVGFGDVRPRPRGVAIGCAAMIPLVTLAALWTLPRTGWWRNDDDLLATFDGREIRVSDMARDDPESVEAVGRLEYEVRRAYVRRKLASLAIQAEAKSLGIAPEELVRRTIDAPLEEERKRLEASAGEMSPDDPARAGRIVRTMLADLRQSRTEAWWDAVIARHTTQDLVRPPPGRRVELDGTLGVRERPGSGRWELVVFSDLTCPVCAELDGTLETLLSRLGTDLGVTYRHFPLRSHPHAADAAVLAEGVLRLKGVEGFRAFKRAVFLRRGEVSPATLAEDAKSAGLTEAQVAQSLEDAEARERVERSAREADRKSVV